MEQCSSREEIANSVTHGIGAGLSIAALILLLVLSWPGGDATRVISLAIYGATLILLYLASTLYHAARQARAKRLLRRMDHASIFLLIAGSYTPIALVGMGGTWGWTLFALIWTMAAGGVIFEMIFFDRYKRITVGFYIVMGWTALVAIKPMMELCPAGFLKWVFLGGVFYTGGVVFYVWRRLPYHHAIWHLFVLTGSGVHFFGVLFYLTRLHV